MLQIYTDEREVQVSERMTEEAVRVSMQEAGVAEPVFDQVCSIEGRGRVQSVNVCFSSL